MKISRKQTRLLQLANVFCIALALCWGARVAQSETVPIGVASWYDTETQNTSRAFGPGGAPTLNYQKADNSWDFIVDDWVQIGQRQLWKSTRGNHRVWADSLGATIYAKGNHYLGMEPPILGRFDKTDSSWTKLSDFEPDSVTVAGNVITYWGAYYGVNVRAINEAKVVREFAPYEFEFTQAFRDSAANLPAGFWQDAMIATAIPLITDSLNLNFQKLNGDAIPWTSAGTIIETDAVNGVLDGARVWSLYSAKIEGTDIPVHKRLVLTGGQPYLVEIFSPLAVAALPDGSVFHSARFGDDSQNGSEVNGSGIWGSHATPSSAGDLDSVVFRIKAGSFQLTEHCRMGIFHWDPWDLIDTTADFSGGGLDDWYQKAVINGNSISNCNSYSITMWAESGITTYYDAAVGDSTLFDTDTYSTSWDDPLTPIFRLDRRYSAYAVYTETGTDNCGGGATGQVIIIGGD